MANFFKITFVCSLFLWSCTDKSDPLPAGEEDVIQPIKIGTGRIVKSTYYYTDGSIGKTSMDTSYWFYEKEYMGDTWYGNYGGNSFYTNKADGLHWYIPAIDKSFLLYKYPCKKGESYKTNTYQGESVNDGIDQNNLTSFEMQVINTKESVKLEATGETYDNVILYRKPKITKGKITDIVPAEWYLKPGVGMVLFQSYYDEARTKISARQELIGEF